MMDNSSTGGESNPFNFTKFVEIDDKITITPYETKDKPLEKPIKKNDPNIDTQTVGNKEDNSNQKKLSNEEEKKITEWLIQYFKNNQIKKISLKDGKLIITHNNNNDSSSSKIVNNNQLSDSSEYQSLKNSLEKFGKSELTSQELGINSNFSTNTNNPSSENKYLWLAGGISVGIIVAGILVFLLRQKKRKIN